MEVELKVRENIRGHYVEFTIGNQTFKTITFTSKGSKERAEEYKNQLGYSFDRMVSTNIN